MKNIYILFLLGVVVTLSLVKMVIKTIRRNLTLSTII